MRTKEWRKILLDSYRFDCSSQSICDAEAYFTTENFCHMWGHCHQETEEYIFLLRGKAIIAIMERESDES